VDKPTGNLLGNPLFVTGDADLRSYPDFMAFAPEPTAGVTQLVALSTLAGLAGRRRYRTRARPG